MMGILFLSINILIHWIDYPLTKADQSGSKPRDNAFLGRRNFSRAQLIIFMSNVYFGLKIIKIPGRFSFKNNFYFFLLTPPKFALCGHLRPLNDHPIA